MKPIVQCRIKFGRHVLDGPFSEGHHGLLKRAAASPEMAEDLQISRLEGGLCQGFADSEGKWVDRLSARIVAEALRQVAPEKFHHRTLLFSEDFLEEPK